MPPEIAFVSTPRSTSLVDAEQFSFMLSMKDDVASLMAAAEAVSPAAAAAAADAHAASSTSPSSSAGVLPPSLETNETLTRSPLSAAARAAAVQPAPAGAVHVFSSSAGLPSGRSGPDDPEAPSSGPLTFAQAPTAVSVSALAAAASAARQHVEEPPSPSAVLADGADEGEDDGEDDGEDNGEDEDAPPSSGKPRVLLNRHRSRLQLAKARASSGKEILDPSLFERLPKWPLSDFSCSCRRSRCLKLYCECFSSESRCGPQCGCVQCMNTGLEEHRTEFYRAYVKALEANPVRFAQEVEGAACACKNSQCLKRYCVCFRQGRLCSAGSCRCVDCQNQSRPSSLLGLSEVASQFENGPG